jgi:3',5'-cyclic AMP phosphodiesterase CpdA
VNEVEVIVLDSTAVTAAQTRWLRRTLAQRTGFRRIAVFHHPPYTCGTYLGHAAIQRSWVPLLERAGVRLVLSGHDHNYQRFVRNGVTYVVHGGGAGLKPVRRCPRSYPPRPASRAVLGFVHVVVEEDGFLVRIVDYHGRAIDRFRVT